MQQPPDGATVSAGELFGVPFYEERKAGTSRVEIASEKTICRRRKPLKLCASSPAPRVSSRVAEDAAAASVNPYQRSANAALRITLI
jgi:hypothetical protein